MRVYTDRTQGQEFIDLGTAGYTGALNDRQFAFLRAQGYTNSLADMFAKWRSAGGGGSYDYLITNDAEWATIPSGLQTGGGRIGIEPGSYTAKTISFTPSSQLTFAATDPNDKPIIDELTIDGGRKLLFEDLNLVSSRWAADANGYGAVMLGGTISDFVRFRRCELEGNYRGVVGAPTFDVTLDTYPEYACITPVFTGGVVTALTIQRETVGDLMADGTYSLIFNNTGNGTFSVAPVATFTVASGIITGTTLTSGGASTFSDSAGVGILSNIISWTGQRRMTNWMPFGVKGLSGAVVSGEIEFTDCTFDFFVNAFKPSGLRGPVVFERNDMDRIYADYFSAGHAGGSTAHPSISFRFNRGTRPFSKPGDPGDPHSDYFQYFMNDLGSPSTVNMSDCVLEGNIFWDGATRGAVQGFIIADNPAGIYYDRWRVSGNLLVSSIQTLGIDLEALRDCYLYRNTVVHYDLSLTNGTKQIRGAVVGAAGQNWFGDNISELFSTNSSSAIETTGNVQLGLEGATIPYDTVFASPTASRTTVAETVAAYTPEAAYTGKGAVGGGYVDFVNRTIDRSLEPTHMRFPEVTGQALSTQIESSWTCVKGGVAGRTISVTGGEYSIASDSSGTGASAYTSSSGTVNPGQFVRLRQTTSGSGATGTTCALTVGGTTFNWQATTVSTAAFVTIDNQTTAYSRAASIPNETALKKLVIAFRMKPDTLVAGANLIAENLAAGCRIWTPSTTAFRAQFFSGTRVSLRPSLTATTAMKTHIITLDMSNTNATEGCYWATLEDGVLLNNAPGTGGSFDTRTTIGSGTDYGAFSFPTSASGGLFGTGAALGIFAEADGGGTILNGAFEFLWMDWGGSGYTIPDITDSGVRNQWLADNIGANGQGPTGSTPKLYWTATDLTQANSGGGIANLGSVSSVPMVKQAGTYA